MDLTNGEIEEKRAKAAGGGDFYNIHQAAQLLSDDLGDEGLSKTRDALSTLWPGGRVPADFVRIGATNRRAMKTVGQSEARISESRRKEGVEREKHLEEIEIPGYKIAGNVRPQPVEAKQLRTTIAATNDFTKGVGRLEELIKKNGSSIFIGAASGEAETLAANLKLTLKEVQNLGVLSATDMQFLNSQVFDPTALRSIGTRRATALKSLETIKSRAKSGLNESLAAHGYAPKPSSGEIGAGKHSALLDKYGVP